MTAFKNPMLYTVTASRKKGLGIVRVHPNIEAHTKAEAIGRAAKKHHSPWNLTFKAELQLNQKREEY